MSTFKALFLLLLGIKIGHCSRVSGIYVDNGFDQTIVHKLVEKNEKRAVEIELLGLLGLEERPRKVNHDKIEKRKKHSAPKFLIELYKNKLNPNKTNSDFDALEYKIADQSDVIVTFPVEDYKTLQRNSIGRDYTRRLWFNVSGISSQNQEVIGAEMRIYRSIKGNNKNPHFTITAYRIVRLGRGNRELIFSDSVNVTSGYEGWIKLNLSQPFQKWIEDPVHNRGIYMAISSNHQPDKEVKPKDVGLVDSYGDPEKQPFMVGYLKLLNHAQKIIKPKRGASDLVKSSKNVPYDYLRDSYHRLKPCSLNSLYVSFKDLNWKDWIIAPEGYDASFCSGTCNFPLGSNIESTNHAVLQALAHVASLGEIPQPCCAPSKLRAISVLYFDRGEKVVMKNYENMVAQTCGCL